jgi:hypothetical protein
VLGDKDVQKNKSRDIKVAKQKYVDKCCIE